MATNYEVVIVGGGVMGSATAYYLSKHFGSPHKVLLLEQFEFLHRRGSSHGESRIIRRTYLEEHYAKLMADAFGLWKDVEKEAQTKLLTTTGSLDFYRRDNDVLKDLIKACQRHNIPHELLASEEVKQKFPAITLPTSHVALYTPEAGIIRGGKAVAVFQSLARQHGCDFRDNCTVVNIAEEKNPNSAPRLRIITSNGDEFEAKKCVIVAGAWTKKLLKNCFDVGVPLCPIQTTVAYWKVDDPQLYSPDVFPVFNSYDDPMAYGIPIQEYPNLVKCCPYFGPECDPDNRDFRPDADLLENQAKVFVQNVLTGVHSTPVLTETCIYTESPDRDYIIDKIPSNPNVSFGCGFSGHGFKLAVIVGKMLAELATTGRALYPDEQNHFALSRFSSKPCNFAFKGISQGQC